MERKHLNERGSHTSIIAPAESVVVCLKKVFKETISFSPGKISVGVGAKGMAIKFKHINDELYEMVVTYNGQKQEFKVMTKHSFDEITTSFLQDKKLRNVHSNYLDARTTRKDSNKNLDDRYRVKIDLE